MYDLSLISLYFQMLWFPSIPSCHSYQNWRQTFSDSGRDGFRVKSEKMFHFFTFAWNDKWDTPWFLHFIFTFPLTTLKNHREHGGFTERTQSISVNAVVYVIFKLYSVLNILVSHKFSGNSERHSRKCLKSADPGILCLISGCR